MMQVEQFKVNDTYSQTSNIRHNKSQNLDISRLIIQLSLTNPLMQCTKPLMKM